MPPSRKLRTEESLGPRQIGCLEPAGNEPAARLSRVMAENSISLLECAWTCLQRSHPPPQALGLKRHGQGLTSNLLLQYIREFPQCMGRLPVARCDCSWWRWSSGGAVKWTACFPCITGTRACVAQSEKISCRNISSDSNIGSLSSAHWEKALTAVAPMHRDTTKLQITRLEVSA